MKKTLSSILIVTISTVVSLVFAEVACHYILNPIDYLTPDRESDAVLRYKILPGSGGHDEWGFRNKEVPEKVSVVVIGDSQTYGYNATLDFSYPAQLGKLLNKTVYNLSLGGYGPVQYDYLLSNFAIKLKPEYVIAGLYFGNDIADAYNTAYTLDHWKNLRSANLPDSKDSSETSMDDELIKKKKKGIVADIRHWLAGNSIIYQILTKVVFKNLGSIGSENNADTDNAVPFKNEKLKIEKILTPQARFRTVDTTRTKIKEGLRITLDRLNSMAATCKSNNIKFIVLYIPTAEYVLSDHFKGSVNEQSLDNLQKLVDAENYMRAVISENLALSQTPVIDGASALKSKLGITSGIYLPGPDGHPTAAGYGILSEAIQQKLLK
ncbi:MAG: SGNH/GDSL hydrolase family protein [Bacteroidia bacterium]|nr:SGNH/GDSL hydrolase family protein [Bacteroidia bacterium]